MNTSTQDLLSQLKILFTEAGDCQQDHSRVRSQTIMMLFQLLMHNDDNIKQLQQRADDLRQRTVELEHQMEDVFVLNDLLFDFITSKGLKREFQHYWSQLLGQQLPN